ncbi:MAG: hypothetical protein WA966_15010 [Ornithinimicrobium sp.]
MKSRPRSYASSDQANILDATANHVDKILDHYADFGFSTDWGPADVSLLRWEEGRLKRQIGPGTVKTSTYWTGTAKAKRTVKTTRYWDSSAAGRAAESCLLMTSQSAQYLEALRVLLRDRQVIFAPVPLTRSIFEIAGYVAWLLDPNINSVRDRAARTTLAQISDATRAKAAATQLGHPNASKLGGAVHKLRQVEVPALFYPSEIQAEHQGPACPTCGARRKTQFRLRDQHQPGLEESLTYITTATRSSWNTGGMYAYLSNASHPTPHVVYESLHRDSNGLVTGFAHDDVTLPYRVTRMAILSFLVCWRMCAGYRGLDQVLPLRLGLELDDLPSL